MDRFHLSNTERLVMEQLWTLTEPTTQAHLLDLIFQNGKVWSRQTLNTLLQRLENKGFVLRENRTVRALCSREMFGIWIAKDAMENYYNGRTGAFMTAFAQECGLSDEEKRELKKFINDMP